MEKNLNTEKTVMAIATYKPKAGKEQTLLELVQKHLPALRELQLASERSNFVAKSQNGTIIEVFEWTSMDAARAAHQHPAIWENMAQVADLVPMSTLQEGEHPFAGFEIINHKKSEN
jgi:quinol monooxygenase YgiN